MVEASPAASRRPTRPAAPTLAAPTLAALVAPTRRATRAASILLPGRGFYRVARPAIVFPPDPREGGTYGVCPTYCNHASLDGPKYSYTDPVTGACTCADRRAVWELLTRDQTTGPVATRRGRMGCGNEEGAFCDV